MNRQNVASMIRFLSLFLLLFTALYFVWIKQTDVDRDSPPTPSAPEPLAPPPSDSAPIAPGSLDTPPDSLQARLIEVGAPPSTLFGQIRDDLDRGNYREAEANLHKLSKKDLTGRRAKEFTAALWNNLGVLQERSLGIQVSVKAFEQAVALAPKHPVALLNLTHAYWELHDPALTPKFLTSVLQVVPDDTFSRVALADLLIEQGHTTEAGRHLKHVEARIAANPDVEAYFQRVNEKLNRRIVGGQSSSGAKTARPSADRPHPAIPNRADSPPSPQPSQHLATLQGNAAPSTDRFDRPARPEAAEYFSIQFDGQSDPDTALRIRSILNFAYEEMSKKFGYTPIASIRVVLHPDQKFAPEAGSPAGADSLYDQASSTIHLPLEGAMEDLAILSRILRHQFAHALLQDKLRAQGDHVPSWLIEGLAIQLAEDPWPRLDEIKQKQVTVIPLSSLEQQWNQSHTDTQDLSYLESATAVQNLIDHFGMAGIRRLLNLLKTGKPLAAAMKQQWSLSYGQFQRDWEQSFIASIGQQ